MFFSLSILLTIVVIHLMYIFIIDIIKHRRGTIGIQKIKQQQQSVGQNMYIFSDTFISKIILLIKWYEREFGLDTGKWVGRRIFLEIIEIILQSQALLLYNGLYLFNTNKVYLAYNSSYIILFSIGLHLNCIFCGILWLFYAFKPTYCYGLLFELIRYAVDVIFDLFYALFPIIIVVLNTEDSNIYVSLASLQTENTLRAN